MRNPVHAIYEDMIDRCEHVLILSRHDVPATEPVEAVGILVMDDSGTLLAIEAGIDVEGMGTVTVRTFDRDVSPVEPRLVELGESVMITTR